MALSDSAFVYLTAHDTYFSGHFIDIGWAAAFLTFGMAALISRGVPQTEVLMPQVPSRVSMWLPYVPLVIAVAGVYSEYLPTRRAGADLRIVDPADERGDAAGSSSWSGRTSGC